MWPRDAFVGQRVVAIHSASNQIVSVEKGTIYTIAEIILYRNHVYLQISEIPDWRIHWSMFKPVDESRLDVFREMLRHAKDKNLDRANA